MPSLLVILNGGDIAPARLLAQQHPDAVALVFDPLLVDKVRAAGLGPPLAVDWQGGPSYRERSDEAHRLARELGAALDAATEPLWPDLALGSWQHLSLHYLHMALDWYSTMGDAVLGDLPAGTLLVPFCDKPQTYYFASFVPALMLVLAAQRRGRSFQVYAHGRGVAGAAEGSRDGAAEDPQPVPQLAAARPAGAPRVLLSHLPTCFYDAAYIKAEIEASGLPALDLPARYWHVPVGSEAELPLAGAAQMQATLAPATQARIEAVTQALAAPLAAHLARWMTAPAFLERQVRQLQSVYRAQLVTHALVHRYFTHQPPARLLLSDHDADFHGPLAAFARHRRVPLVVLPHSKASTDLDFVARDATVLYHVIQGDTVYDVHGRRPAQFMLDLPSVWQFTTPRPGPLRRVGLLLNGVSLNGVPSVDLPAYAQGVRRIVQWCNEHGLALSVRSRPGQTLFASVLEPAGLDAAQMQASVEGSMAEFAQGCDLCLMYDAPTSGALECLNRAVPLLNPVLGALTKRETGSMNAALVPRANLEDTLRYATTLLGDPLELQRLRLQQFLAYASRYAQARPLRTFL